MPLKPPLCSINKKGSALAFVIIISAALIIMVMALFVISGSSIAASDSGIKAREAYLSSKSGIEFIKSCVITAVSEAQGSLNDQIAEKDSDPNHVVSMQDKTFYGFGSLSNGFTMDGTITESSAAYKNARIKIVFSVAHQLSFDETDETTGAGTYKDAITITASSTGKSEKASIFTDILEKGVLLTFKRTDEVTANYSGESGSSGNVIPDTGGNGSPGIPVTDEWPTEENNPGSGGDILSGGSTFIYNGAAYYVVMYNTWIEVGSTPSDYPSSIILINPGSARDMNGWNGYPLTYNKNLSNFNAWLHLRDGGPDINRGDKVIYNGVYYILRDEPSTVSWVNTPPGYPWFIIPNQ